MALTILENRKINSNKRKFNSFLDNFHQYEKRFTIDCDHLNLDFFNSQSIVTIRHAKPNKESIYYTEIYKEDDETVYLFGLARENVIATSSYMDEGAQIRPILVATLNTENSSKSNLVFANNSKEYTTDLLLRIDCSELNDLELKVLKDKNSITKLDEGLGFINFGAIEKFNVIKNIRNFISNVDFEYDNARYVKILRVSIPEDYRNLDQKPNMNLLRDRFINNEVEVFDSNDYDDDSNEDSDGKADVSVSDKNSDDAAVDSGPNDDSHLLSDDSSMDNESDLVADDSSMDNESDLVADDSSMDNESGLVADDSSMDNESGLVADDSSLDDEQDSSEINNVSNEYQNYSKEDLFADMDVEDDLLDLKSNYIVSDSNDDHLSQFDEDDDSPLDIYRLFFIDGDCISFELSIYRIDFFKIMQFYNNLIALYNSIWILLKFWIWAMNY